METPTHLPTAPASQQPSNLLEIKAALPLHAPTNSIITFPASGTKLLYSTRRSNANYVTRLVPLNNEDSEVHNDWQERAGAFE